MLKCGYETCKVNAGVCRLALYSLQEKARENVNTLEEQGEKRFECVGWQFEEETKGAGWR